MRGVLLLVVLALTAHAQDGRFERFCSRSAEGRTTRGLPCGEPLAFFEFAPASGAGMGTECACAAVTGAKGEALTFSRASSATCTPGVTGTRTTGIADNSLVTCANNQPRIERDNNGVLGFRVESAGSNVLLRFIDYANAAWTDVGTPTLTGGQTSPWAGAYATSAVSIDDNDAAAYEGRSQSVTVVSGQPYNAHCLVKAGTLTDARISLDGTPATITGLTSTWDIIEVSDASASSASISFQLMNGDSAGDTGSVVWGGCQVEAGGYRTSMIPTEGSTVARAVDDRPYFAVSAFSPRCIAASLTPLWTSATSNRRAVRADTGGSDAMRFDLWVSGASLQTFANDGVSNTTVTQAVSGLPATARLMGLLAPATTLSAVANGSQTNAATAVSALSANRVYVGAYAGATGFEADGIITRVQVDTSLTGCTP